MIYVNEIAVALAEIDEAEEALRHAVRAAHQALGTTEIERALRVVHKCQRERDRANERFVALQLSHTAVFAS